MAKLVRNLTFLFLAAVYTNNAAASGPNGFTVLGGLYTSEGEPLNGFFDFQIQIMDSDSTCVLYEEFHNAVDLTTTNGEFSLSLGQGSSRKNNVDGSEGLNPEIYRNDKTLLPFTGCASGITFQSTDSRKLRVSYNPGPGLITLQPDIEIQTTPYSAVAQTLNGKSSNEFLQVNEDQNLTQQSLQDLANGLSSVYYKPGSLLDMSFQQVINLPNPTMPNDAATKNYVDSIVSTGIGGKASSLTTIDGSQGDGRILTWDQGNNQWIAAPATIGGDFKANGSVTATSAFNLGSNQINNVADPAVAQDAATKNYVDTQGFLTSETGDISAIATTAGSGLTGGATSGASSLSVDITGATVEATIAAGDEILIYDSSATALRKMTRANFVSGIDTNTQLSEANVETFINNAAFDMGTNKITGLADPTLVQDAATKNYVDTQISGSGAGDFMANGSVPATADLALATNKITGLGDPTLAQDAATKNYVDTQGFLTSESGDIQAITTAADSGLAGGATTGSPNLSVDITNTTAETAIAAGDEILIYDASATALKKMTRANFIAGIDTVLNEATVDGYASNNGYLTSETGDIEAITTVADSGLSGGATTGSPSLSVDITNTTAETTVAAGDEILIYDASATSLKKMTRANFIAGINTNTQLSEAAVETFINNANFAMGTNKITGLGDPTLAQDAATKNYVDGKSWTLADVTDDGTMAAETATNYVHIDGSQDMTAGLTVTGSADEVQLTAQANATQTTNVNVFELKSSAGTVMGSFRADGTVSANDNLVTKAWVDAQGFGVGSGDITEVTTAADSGLTGGSLTNAAALSVDVTGTTAETTIAAGDEILIYDASATALKKMTRANFIAGIDTNTQLSEATVDGYVSNNGFLTSETGDIEAITTAADSGLAGGATTGSPSMSVDITNTTAETAIAAGDEILIYDASATALKKMTRANFIAGIDTNTQLNEAAVETFINNADFAMSSNKITGLADPTLAQDAATKNYVDTQGFLTSESGDIQAITTAADSGLAGGATTGSPSLSVDITSTTAETTVAAGDEILIYDASATALKKMTRANFIAGIDTDTQLNEAAVETFINNADFAMSSNKITGLADPTLAQDAATKNYVDTQGFLTSESGDIQAITTAADSGLTGGATTGSPSLSVDITSTTAETTVAAGDEILIYDASATALKKMTRANFIAGIDTVLNEATVDGYANNNGYLTSETGDIEAITTVANSGLAGGATTGSPSLSVDITGTTAETAIAAGDEILIYDASATALKKMTRANFISGIDTNTQLNEATVDGYADNNGYFEADGSVAMGANLDMGSGTFKIVDLADPTLAQDAATKNYVDTQGYLSTQSLDGAYDDGSSVTVDSTDVIYNLSSTQDFHIQDAGGAAFTVTDSGNVGIGTTTPGVKLDVYGDASTYPQVRIIDDLGNWGKMHSPRNGYAYLQASGPWRYSATSHNFMNQTGLTQYMVIDGSGNVGIGTTGPGANLDISASADTKVRISNTNTALTTEQTVGRIAFYQSDISSNATGERAWIQAVSENSSGQHTGLAFGTRSSDGTEGLERVRIDKDGNVGIGMINPAQKLDVSGNVQATAYYYSSDRRLKKEITDIGGLEKILKLRGVRFKWIKDGRPDVGLIAQEVEKVFPDLVFTNPVTGFKAVQYGNLVAPLIEATKEMMDMIEANRSDIDRLKGENREIRDELDELKKAVESIRSAMNK